MQQERDKVQIGIDLGTTYSSMAYVAIKRTGHGAIPVTRIATDDTEDRPERIFIPSAVCATLNDEAEIVWTVGAKALQDAKELGKRAHLYLGYKLRIGFVFDQKDNPITLDTPDGTTVTIDVTPDQIAEKLVAYLYNLAFGSDQAPLGDSEPTSVSVSVPALWRPENKQAVINLVERAGFSRDTIRTVEEPIAALYNFLSEDNQLLRGAQKYVMVIDYGGGTCDIAIVKTSKNADKLLARGEQGGKVVGRGSIDRGGINLDRRIAEELLAPQLYDLELSESLLLVKAEQVKIAFANLLRDQDRTYPLDDSLILRHVIELPDGKREIETSLEHFRGILKPELSKQREPIEEALNFASFEGGKKISLADIVQVFLTGGTALLPLVTEEVQQIFGETERGVRIYNREPRRSIVYGTALYAYYCDYGLIPSIAMTLRHDIWLDGIIRIVLAKRGTRLPHQFRDTVFFTSFEQTNEISVLLYQGNKDNFRQLGRPQTFALAKPARIGSRFRIEGEIDESGLVTISISRIGSPNEKFELKREAPIETKSDMEAMEERTKR